MSKQDIHADQSRQERYQSRTLEARFPTIMPYLSVGAKVLDDSRRKTMVEELDNWCRNPNAFAMGPIRIQVVGKVR